MLLLSLFGRFGYVLFKDRDLVIGFHQIYGGEDGTTCQFMSKVLQMPEGVKIQDGPGV